MPKAHSPAPRRAAWLWPAVLAGIVLGVAAAVLFPRERPPLSLDARFAAIRQLAASPTKDDVPALVAALEDPAPGVRSIALGALGRLGEGAREAVPAAARRTLDSDPVVGASALQALRALGAGRAALGPLLDALDDPDPKVRLIALSSLGQLGRDAAPAIDRIVKALPADPVLLGPAATTLRQLGARDPIVVSAAIRALGDAGVDDKTAALKTLEQLGPRAVAARDALLDLARRPGPSRAPALRALASLQVHDVAIVAAARDALTDADAQVAATAKKALATLERYAPPVHLVGHGDPRVRFQAARDLGRRTVVPETVPALVALLGDPDPSVREAAAESLGMLMAAGRAGSPGITRALLQRVNDRAVRVRAEVAQALASAGGSPESVAGLVRLLEDSEVEVFAAAAGALALLGPRGQAALPALFKAADSPDASVAAAALSAIVTVGEPVVKLDRGPCLGRCPVYTLSLYEDGHLLFVGDRYVRKTGPILKRLAVHQVRQVRLLFEQAGFSKLGDRYLSLATDLPSVTLTFREGDVRKQVTFESILVGSSHAAIQKRLSALAESFENVVGSADWVGPREEFDVIEEANRRVR
jgi:HEAT repeat protein